MKGIHNIYQPIEGDRLIYEGAGSKEQVTAIDERTQTYNFALFKQLVEKEVERSEWRGHVFSVLMAEIDNFHNYFDAEGRSVGDDVLKKFARLMKSEIRPGDIIGRSGEAEFAVILPETDLHNAQELAEQVRKKAEWTFTISTGIACYQRDASDAQSLLDKARAALQAAKASGGDVL